MCVESARVELRLIYNRWRKTEVTVKTGVMSAPVKIITPIWSKSILCVRSSVCGMSPGWMCYLLASEGLLELAKQKVMKLLGDGSSAKLSFVGHP